MTNELAPAGEAVDFELNAQAAAKTFGVVDFETVTIPQIIRAIIDSDTGGLPFAAADDAGETAVLERLARAETTDALFNDGAATGWGELVDVPVEVHGFRLLPSTMEGAITFAVVDIYRLDEGERTVVTTSSRGVLVQLLQGVLVGAIPGRFKLTEVGAEKKGRNRPQRLVRLGDLQSAG